MAADHDLASQAATWAVPVLMLVTTAGGLIEWVRREIKAIAKHWDDRAVTIDNRLSHIDARVSDLASGHIADHDAWKLQVDQQIRAVESDFDGRINGLDTDVAKALSEHERLDLERFNVVHRRLDDVHRDMATQEQVGRVQSTTDRILLLLAENGQRKA